MRKILLPLLFITLLLAASAPAYDESAVFITELPDHFTLTAVSGSISPDYPVYKIEITKNGEGIYSVMSAENRKYGKFEKVSSFKLTKSDLLMIYESVVENQFFDLKKEYIDRDILDGSFAELTVTVDKKTHTVRTRNIAVTEFDRIMITINIATPKDNKIIYNEILR